MKMCTIDLYRLLVFPVCTCLCCNAKVLCATQCFAIKVIAYRQNSHSDKDLMGDRNCVILNSCFSDSTPAFSILLL